MTQNYRSTGNILRAANNLISRNKVRVKKEMVTGNEEGEEIEILAGQNEIEEAELIAQRIVELKGAGYRYDEIAILVRVHRLTPLIEAALICHFSLKKTESRKFERNENTKKRRFNTKARRDRKHEKKAFT